MKVLLTGAAGQLGQALREQLPEGLELVATSRHGGNGLVALDLSDAEACREAVRMYRPEWVLNAGAYTAVDKAETEPELAMVVNAGAPRAFAEALHDQGGCLLQVSTDFVFNGKQGSPYRPEQIRNPLGVYGHTKAAGEEAVEQVLVSSGQGVILRTSWVMGPVGNNFALTMLRLHRERGCTNQSIGVVADQLGCPTSTHTLATACWAVIQSDIDKPVLHWSDAGAASWYDVAVAVGEISDELNLVERMASVNPLTTADYPTPTERPSYSLLDSTQTRSLLGLPPIHWRQALRKILERAG